MAVNMLIGDYIHYKWSNYQKYGLGYGTYETKEVGGASRAFNEQRKELQKRARTSGFKKAGIKQQLEDQLNFFFNPTVAQAVKWGYSAQDVKKLQETMETILSKSTDAAMDKVKVDYGDLSAQAYQNTLDRQLQSVINKYGQLSTVQTSLVGIEKRMQSLMTLHRRIGQETLKNPNPNLVTLQARIGQLQKDYQQLLVDLKGSNTVKNQESFIKTLNDLIEDVQTTSAAHVSGALAETLPVVTEYLMQNSVNQNIDDLLSGFADFKRGRLMGADRSQKVVDSQKFIGKSNNYEWKTRFGDIDYNIRTTQSKVDVQLTLPNGITYPASVKNYSKRASDYHILTGISMLKYTQNYPSFMNHYLNITSMHAEGGPSDVLITDAHNTMKLTILLGAIAGGLLNSTGQYDQQAELFITNTHGVGKGQYKVYFIDDIIDKVINDPSLFKIKNYPKLWQNQWIGGPTKGSKQAYLRIANILAQLHSFQLSASISKKAMS